VTDIRYVFGNLRTGAVLEEIALYGVSPMTIKLNDWGSFGATFSLDQTGRSNADLVNAVIPLQSYVIVEREGIPVWGGIVWTAVHQSQSKSVQLSARSFEAYFERQKILSDFTRTDIEQRNIFRDLVNQLQADPNTNLGLSVPGSYPTVVAKTLTVLASERKTYTEAFSNIADGDDGFDWRIDVVKTAGGAYHRRLLIGHPQLGTIDPTGRHFEYPGNITNYYKTASGSESGTHVFIVGQGEGSSTILGTYVHQDLIDSGTWLRYDLDISKKQVTNAQLAQSLADKIGPQRRPPMKIFKVFVKGDLDPPFGSYGVGDSCTLVISDAMHPDTLQAPARIVGMAYKPPTGDDVEEVELIFEGDELNDG
jgi:hypothetical protein